MFYAYVHCRPDFSPFYVGKGQGSRCHKMNRTHNPHHQNIVKKYGAENILVGKLDCSSEEIAFELEIGLIKCLSRSGVKLVNLTEGGDGVSGHIHSAETRKKIGNIHRGKTMSPEACKKIAEAGRGRSHNAAAKLKMSIFAKNRSEEHQKKLNESRERNGGWVVSPETRAKIAAKHMRKVQCIETGQVFKSTRAAGQWYLDQGLTTCKNPNMSVNKAISQKIGLHGYHWKLASSHEPYEIKTRSVLCSETDLVFESAKSAAQWCIAQGLTQSKTPEIRINQAIKFCRTAYGYHWRLVHEDQ